MKCTECGREMQKGIVEIRDAHLLSQIVVSWFPEEEKNKFIRKNAISLNFKADGYYCDECMRVVAIFEQR